MYRPVPTGRTTRGWLWIVAAAVLLTAGSAHGQEDPKPSAEPAAEATAEKKAEETPQKNAAASAAESQTPATAEVKKGTIRIALELEGIAEAATAHEIVVRPEEWTASAGLVVTSAVAHGARVRKGHTLIAFDTTKLDREIEDLQTEVNIGGLSLKQAEQQLQALEETTPIELAANQRSGRIAEEDRKYQLEKQQPFEARMAEFQLRSAKNSLEYAQEELDQLRKMYEADDLTEETEAIVLKRAENSVESAKMQVASAQMRHDLAMEFTLPRQEEQIKETSLRKRLETQRAQINLPMALEKQRLEVAKLSQQQARSRDKLKKLREDRELLTVKSPADGLVYYGKFTRGKPGDVTALADNLREFGKVQPNQVLMTIVQPQPLSIRLTVPEDKLHRLRVGLAGTAVPKAYPALKLPVVVSKVSAVPLGPGNFEAQLKLTRSKQAEQLLPGMTCTVRMEPYLTHDALYIPPKTLMTDERNPDKQYVWLLKDGKPVRRDVTVGEKTDDRVEILKGLAEGDRILLEAPKKDS